MATNKQKEKWYLHVERFKYLILQGMNHGEISLYSEELIEKLRGIYYLGHPASILLLCSFISNGDCEEKALLMARAFLDSDDDVRLVYGSINTMRLNPKHIDSGVPSYGDHCFVERTTKDGKHLIYDTTFGLVFDKHVYWNLEQPKVRKVNNKGTIIKLVKSMEQANPESFLADKDAALATLPIIEKFYDSPFEMYSDRLQREVEIYKKLIGYDELKSGGANVIRK